MKESDSPVRALCSAMNCHVHFQQAVHAVLRPGQVEEVQPCAALRYKIDDTIGSGFLIHGMITSIDLSEGRFAYSPPLRIHSRASLSTFNSGSMVKIPGSSHFW